jgi:hypothetical protein
LERGANYLGDGVKAGKIGKEPGLYREFLAETGR